MQIAGSESVAQTPLTADEVRRWLICTERGAAEDIRRGSTSPGTDKVWKWTEYIKDTDTLSYLKAWIWCRAHGESFKEICRQRAGWSVRTGQRKVDDAIRIITARLAFEVATGGADVAGVLSHQPTRWRWSVDPVDNFLA